MVDLVADGEVGDLELRPSGAENREALPAALHCGGAPVREPVIGALDPRDVVSRQRLVVTNQSGIGRGLMTHDDYRRVEARVAELLAEGGATLDATYHCPHSPADDPPCDCRKPGTRLYRQAADDLAIDMQESWWVGDRMSDLDPARAFEAKAVLVETGYGSAHGDAALERDIPVVPNIGAAVDRILDPGSS